MIRGFVTQRYRLGAAASAALIGSAGLLQGTPSKRAGELSLTVDIIDGTDDQLIARYNIDHAGGLSNPSEVFRTRVGVPVASRFPYRKR